MGWIENNPVCECEGGAAPWWEQYPSHKGDGGDEGEGIGGGIGVIHLLLVKALTGCIQRKSIYKQSTPTLSPRKNI